MDMTKLCRTCLKKTDDNTISIYLTIRELTDEQRAILDIPRPSDPNDNDSFLGSNLTLNNMIAVCSSTISIDPDSLPKQICTDCIRRLYGAYTFRKSCENAFTKLKTLLFGDQDDDGLPLIKKDSEKSAILNEKAVVLNKILRSVGPNEKCIQTDDSCIKLCELCGMKFFNVQKLKEHRTVHKNASIKCRVCSKTFTRFSHLQRHILAKHAKEFDLTLTSVCHICDKRFSRAAHLTRHLEVIHKTETGLKVEQEDADCETHNDVNEESCEMDYEDDPSSSIQDFKEEIEVLPPDEGQHTDDHFEHSAINFRQIDVKPMTNSVNRSVTSNAPKTNYIPEVRQIETKKPVAKAQRIYNCSICYVDFIGLADFQKHKAQHKSIIKDESNPSNPSKPTKAQHQCFDCKKFFSRSCHLKRHMFLHSQERPYSCDLCDKSFNRVDRLNSHRLQHSGERPFSCEHCGKSFARSENLRVHIPSCLAKKSKIVGERIERMFKCDICSKSFQSAKYLKKHSLLHERKSFQCKTCSSNFATNKELCEHTKSHATERPYLCSECGLRFVRHDYLVVHMRRHKGEKPYKCRFCEKGFPRATDLTVHERYHTGEKTHLCTTCGKGFQRAYNLLVHTRVHTGERPYKCPHCPKSFAQGNDLKAHVRRHTGERYKCDICGDGFIQGYHLTQHKRNKHGIDTKSQISRLKKFITVVEGESAPPPSAFGDMGNMKIRNNKQQVRGQMMNQQQPEIVQIDDSSHASTSSLGNIQQTQATLAPFQVSQHNIKLESRSSTHEAQSKGIQNYQQDHQYHHPSIPSTGDLAYQSSSQYPTQQRTHQSFHPVTTTQYITTEITNVADFRFADVKSQNQSSERK